jgi:CheY-like chemotaxis protein
MNRGMCCLLVEDDPDDQEFFIDALHSISSTTGCYAVSSGEEALFTLTHEGFFPDYIFTDLSMPKMSGFEFLRNLRSIEKFREVPVIIYTAGFSEEHIQKAKALDVTAIYSKSRMCVLKDILKKYFSKTDNSRSVL